MTTNWTALANIFRNLIFLAALTYKSLSVYKIGHKLNLNYDNELINVPYGMVYTLLVYY